MLAIAPTTQRATEAPIGICPTNPRYFEWRGHATVLVASGEHYGSVVNPDFDFIKYLDTIQAAGLNHTRLFLGDYVEGADSFGIVSNPLVPLPGRFLAPWVRSATPGFARGGNKFDLDHWNPDYFRRLHAFFDEAERRGIVVEAVLFFVGPGYEFSPFNPANNVNGTTPIDAKRYLSLNSGNVLGRQEQYARKLVSELNRYPNVIFNLCNEPWFYNQEKPGFASPPPRETKAWIRRVSDWVTDEEAHLPLRHIQSVDLTNQGTIVPDSELSEFFENISVLNVHYDSNAAMPVSNPHIPRLLAFNETGFNGTGDDSYRAQGWNFLLSGGGLYGNLDFSFSVGHEDGTGTPAFTGTYNAGGSPAIRKQMGILLNFMQSLPLERMHPANDIVVGGADSWRALAAPGEAYAVWFPGDGPVAPLVALPPGRWRAEWVDILSGSVTAFDFAQENWVTPLKGQRRGGGVGLRIRPADGTARSQTGGTQADSAAPEAAFLVLEDFESYASNEDLAKQWHKPPHGAWMHQALEPNIRSQGRSSIKLEYRLTQSKGQDYAAICTLRKWDLSDYDTLQFWLKPDGAGRDITVQFNVADEHGGNIHDLWEVTYKTQPGDDSPRLVSIPFSSLHHPDWLDAKGKRSAFDPALVIELAAYVGIGTGPAGEGAIFIDDIRAIRSIRATSQSDFESAANDALARMKERAEELKIAGVAVVASFEGESVRSWSSKMLVVGRMKDLPSAGSQGANLLAIAYAKACEMAETHHDSGSGNRPPMVGEFGWQGGRITRTASGYALAAFSGGKSEDDVEVSRAGLEVLTKSARLAP